MQLFVAEDVMSFLYSWGLPIIGLIFGIVGAVLAANVSGGLFWAGWIPGLACIAFFLIKSDSEDNKTTAVDNAPPEEAQQS